MKLKRILLTMAGIVAATSAVTAQSYFDDDIYYNPNKDKTEKAAHRDCGGISRR